jgi:hypothetical protein
MSLTALEQYDWRTCSRWFVQEMELLAEADGMHSTTSRAMD